MQDRQGKPVPEESGVATAGAAAPPSVFHVLGTPLLPTTYEGFTDQCVRMAARGPVVAVDFTNTMIVVLRRHDPKFRRMTRETDYFIPDGMPLIWCLNRQGAGLRDRVYGPVFMRHALEHAADSVSHYFLGGSDDCLARLKTRALELNPRLKIRGSRNGYFTPEEEPAIIEEINRASPDFIWVGLGTPKQQAWIERWRGSIRHGVVLAVGFAFDVNAGTKPDAPNWMQRRGLTWLFRLASEPRRLAGRYLRYNSLFLFYLLWDGLHRKAFKPFSE